MPKEGILHNPRMSKVGPCSILAVVANLNGSISPAYKFKSLHNFKESKQITSSRNQLTPEMASTKLLRSACSFTTLLLCCLNFTLFILSAVSFAPTILLKMPPTSFGMAFLMVSGISLVSSFVGFYSQLTHFCFLTHISLLLASLIGQLLSILALFTKEKTSLSLLKSPRDPKEAKLLVRLECGALMAMCMLQLVVLILNCAVHSCWVKDYEEMEAEKQVMARKRSQRIAKVQEESMVNATKMAEIKAKELDEKMKSKYGQWVKTDFEP